jgi:uncharacterized protein (DUF2235 family)
MEVQVAKNIVICCDGTGNQFDSTYTNVVRLFSVIERHTPEQIGYYDPGVGTTVPPDIRSPFGKLWDTLKGLGFGYGMTENIEEAYRYLMNYYNDGDRIFLFGFSRGALTVRALAAMLHKCGLLEPGADNMLPYAMRYFRYRKNDEVCREFKRLYGRVCPIHFVGVWDTVASVGWIFDPVKFPYATHNPDIRTARHAIAIDERRCFYRQHLFGEGKGGQDIQQVWFAGVHSDVGGGYADPGSTLWRISFAWMVKEAEDRGLHVDHDEYQKVLRKEFGPVAAEPAVSPPDYAGTIHRSVHGPWWLIEYLPKRYWDAESQGYRFKIPRGQPRHMSSDSILHPSVRERQAMGYAPPNLLPNLKIWGDP